MMLLRFVRGHGRRKAARRAARAGDWRAAATAYAALARQGVATVRDRVQLGHSLKEAGDDAAADEAYRAAAAAFPHDRDALLHHGLFLQKLHRDREAIHVLS